VLGEDDEEWLRPCDIVMALPGVPSVVMPLLRHAFMRSNEQVPAGPWPQHEFAYKLRIKPHMDDACFVVLLLPPRFWTTTWCEHVLP
jgi:hypothetical protein